MNKLILSSAILAISSSYADDINGGINGITLDDIQVVATKTVNANIPNFGVSESGNVVPVITKATPQDTAHTTTSELNNMAGISILGGNQAISQNISIGGLNQDNIIVSIDGQNNYFSNFGFNQARLLPNSFLFKQVTLTGTGGNISTGSGDIGGAVNFTTLDPGDLLLGDKLTVGGTLGANTATNGANGNAFFAAKTGKVEYLIDVVGTNDNNMYLGNGTTLPYSANNNFQALAKLVVDISNSQKLKLSFLNMQNQGQYPSVINNIANEMNPPANFSFNQSQASVDYEYKPNNPYFDIKAQVGYQTSSYMAIPINLNGGYSSPTNTTVPTVSLR